MNPVRGGATAWPAMTLIGILLVGCVPAGTVHATPTSRATGLADATAKPPGTGPSSKPSPILPPSDAPTTSVEPTLVPGPSGLSPGAGPPGASIAVEGGDPVPGALGSYTWRNTGSDSPWLPGTPIHIGQDEELTLSLHAPVAVANWTAGRTTPGNLDGPGAIGLGEGRDGPPRFAAPPPGTWSVQVVVWFAANQGSAAYYWLVEVD